MAAGVVALVAARAGATRPPYAFFGSARAHTPGLDDSYGTLLMEEAARIASLEHGSEKIAVISGVGTRDYYRKLGYELEGPYMTKLLAPPGADAPNEWY